MTKEITKKKKHKRTKVRLPSHLVVRGDMVRFKGKWYKVYSSRDVTASGRDFIVVFGKGRRIVRYCNNETLDVKMKM